MTSVTFETATLQVAIKKAARVAPSKGAAFDKASGIVMDVQDGAVVIRATNLDVFYMEWIDFVEKEGDNLSWRLHAQTFSDLVSKLSIASGTTITLTQEGRFLAFKSNKLRGKLNLMDVSYYPVWYAFDPDNMTAVDNFGSRMKQTEWAADQKGQIPICGIYFDGEIMLATNRYQLAVVDLPIPDWGEPICIPGNILSSVLRDTGEVMLGQDANQLLLMPDEHTQIRAVLYDTAYPSLLRIREMEFPQKITVTKAQVIELIDQALALVGSNRNPKIKVYIGAEQVAIMLENAELGYIGNEIEIPGQAVHKRCEIHFTPAFLIEALNAAPGERVEISYDPPHAETKIIRIDGGSGFTAWVMPRRHHEPVTTADGGA